MLNLLKNLNNITTKNIKLNNMEKDLKYWEANAEEDYITTPISVLRYISELEQEVENLNQTLEEIRADYHV